MKSDRLTKLCMDYLPMIKSIATKYKGNGVPLEDLIQEGFLGLLEAEKRFEPSNGSKFSTYAFYWIKKKIVEAVRREKIQTMRLLELNEEILEDNNRNEDYKGMNLDISSIAKNLSQLEQKIFELHFQEGKTLSQIAEELGIRREKVRQIKQLLIRKMRINMKSKKEV